MNHLYFEQAPPRSWDQFEELCADTFQEEWQDAALVRHGRAGQSQHGVDIVGRNGAIWPVGIQCKKKSIWPVSVVTTNDLDKEVEKAKTFEPPLKAFYLISTAPDDQSLQKRARLITERHQAEGLFPVAVVGWNELVRRATRHPLVAAKHFGSYATGPASPLLATWRASGGKLLLDDRELAIAIRELIHDLRDFPVGRIVFQQKETEDLLFEVTQFQATQVQSLEKREAVLALRDKLRIQRDKEAAVVAGLKLLLSHKLLLGLVRFVWKDEATLLIRSIVEQGIEKESWEDPGLQKLRLHPPGDDLHITAFVPPDDIRAVFNHKAALIRQYPTLATDNISELPKHIQARYAVPRVIQKMVSQMDNGDTLEGMERRKWFDMAAWKFTIA